MSDAIAAYLAALERLKRRGAKITNDAVAIEAGNKPGSIKKSRPAFSSIIAVIEVARKEKAQSRDNPAHNMQRLRDDKKRLEALLDESIAREIALLDEVYSLRDNIAALTAGRVVVLGKPKKSAR